MEKINAHIFEYLNKKYIFDVNKNAILSVSDEAYDEIKNNLFLNKESDLLEVNNLKRKGYLSTNRPKRILHPKTEMVEGILKRNVSKLCLQLTQNCNFRCKYCVYSEAYENRVHAMKKMDWNIAKKAIDFLISHSQDALSIYIGFYGGEPLLQYDLIKKCMEYATNSVNGKKVAFTITTNGSLLNEEIVKDFIKYDVRVNVSLDGPRDIQNENRVFADGQGTFDIVTNNIRVLCKKYPEFKENLMYSMVLDPRNGFSCIENFVKYDEELFSESGITSSLISQYYRQDSLNYSEEFISEWEFSKFKYMLYLIGKLSDKYNSKIMQPAFSGIIEFINSTRENYAELGEVEHHSGPCIPGQVRLFTTIDGEFYPCEKVSENSKVMNIGNLNDGFYYDKIKKLLNAGQLTENECKNCFAIRHCDLCSMVADTGNDKENKLSKELKMKACKSARIRLDDKLKDICALKICNFNVDKFQMKGVKYESN